MAEYTALSDYITVAVISEAHHVTLVQHSGTKKFYVRKDLQVYNAGVYRYLAAHPVPGVPRILNVWEENGCCTVIEEYISGETLQEKIDAGRMTRAELLVVMTGLCDILTRLHRATPPLVHRDIKPSNVMLALNGSVVLLDFNAARQFTPGDRDTVLLGTQGYAAPEQYGFGVSTPQTDLYAAGIMLREMTHAAGINDPALDAIADRCTRLEPRERFASADELKQALQNLAPAENSTPAMHRVSKYAPPGFRTRTPWKMLVGALGYVMMILISLRLQVSGMSGLKLWNERFFSLLFQFSIVAGTFNYLDVQKLIPLCQSKSAFGRVFGVLLLDFVLGILTLLIMLMIEYLIFPTAAL